MRIKRIGIVIPTASFFVGGGEVVPLMQAKYLARAGFQVDLITIKPENYSDLYDRFKKENREINFIEIISPDSFPDFSTMQVNHEMGHYMYLALTREINHLCSQRLYTNVITHYAPAAFAIPKNTRQTLILHGVPHSFSAPNEIAANIADSLVAVSNSVKDGWEKMHSISKSINVIQNGIDVEYYKPEDTVTDIDILYIGRLIEIKGVQYLIRALPTIVKEFPRLTVKIGGDGEFKENLQSIVNELGLEDYVEFLGYVADSELLSYYHRSKICVFPSFAKEGVLTTLLEASSCGKPVITSNCCGMVDLVQDNFNGLLFEPRNSEELSHKILQLLSDKKLAKRLGRNATAEIRKHWSWEKSIDKFISTVIDV